MSDGRRHVVLYDGDCGFCTRWKERMAPRDRDGRIEWLSVHDPSVAARFPDLDRDDALKRMWVYDPERRVHKGSDGWRVLFPVLRGMGWVTWLYRIPGAPAVARMIYGWVAARRYRLSCAARGCRLPPPGALVALLGFVLAGLMQAACGTQEPDPVSRMLESNADPASAEIVAAALKVYGGYVEWSARRNVEYRYRLEFFGGQNVPQKESHQIHRLKLGGEAQAYIEDLDGPVFQTVRLDGDAVEVLRGGLPVTDPASLGFPKAYTRIARWTFLQPWALLDPDVRLEIRAERTPPSAGRVPAGPCDVVRLTFADKETTGPPDWWDFYFDRLNHLVDRVHSYRAEDGAYLVTLWSDHRRFDGLRVATRRETHASDVTGAIGAIELVVEYSDIRFDAPFGDEMFRFTGPAPGTAPASEPVDHPAAEPLAASASR